MRRLSRPGLPGDRQVRTAYYPDQQTQVYKDDGEGGAGQKKPVGIMTNRIVVFHKPVEGQKAIAHVAKEKRAEFLKSGRQIACITYTEVAEQELARDLGNDPLSHISTIHRFMWQLIRLFQADIRRWVATRNQEKPGELCQKQTGFGPCIQAKTREVTRREIEECEQLKSIIPVVPKFTSYCP